MAKILMVASEGVPYAKTGGLADVVGSLPQALEALGHDVTVLLPRYGSISIRRMRSVYGSLRIRLGESEYDTSVYEDHAAGSRFYFLDCPALFCRKGLYGDGGFEFPDNHIRFGVLAQAAFAVSRCLFLPDILHCHDWQAGLVPALLRTVHAADPTFHGVRTLFTIHNLGYQGLFPKDSLLDLGIGYEAFNAAGVEFFGNVSFLKAGLQYSDALSTVSPTYAREIQTPEYGFGLDGVLRQRSAVLTGVLNGVDYRDWDPQSDSYIAATYSPKDLGGKRICKEALLREFGFTAAAANRPLIGLVSRFTRQKGADLVAEVVPKIAANDAYLVALGTGDPEYEEFFRRAAAEFPDCVSVRIGFDSRLAHQIEAGADMFLMPSHYEPCGLNQIYSLRYGTVPIVRATGGLDDTVDESTGFKFREYTSEALAKTIGQACAAFGDKTRWVELIRRGMEKDYSWAHSAREYSALYRRLAAKG